MTITESSIKIIASERLNDDIDGGGYMGAVAVIDGVENNLFNDVSSLDRSLGRFAMRKIYPAVITSTIPAETYYGAHIIVDEVPADPAVTAFMFKIGDLTTLRTAALAYFATPGFAKDVSGTVYYTLSAGASIGATSISTTRQSSPGNAFLAPPAVGSLLFLDNFTDGTLANGYRIITAVTPGATNNDPATLTFAGQPLTHAIATGYQGFQIVGMGPSTRVYSAVPTSAGLSPGDTTISLTDLRVRVAPMVADGAPNVADATLIGFNAASLWADGGGYAVSIVAGDMVVVHHTKSEDPQTVTSSQDINLGRINLADVRVYGNDGIRITTGFTVNKATGHIVFSSVSGYSQPVTIKHRVEDMVGVDKTYLATKTIKVNRQLSHTFPSGETKVSAAIVVGDMQARAHTGFQQATWTGVFSDTIIGSSISADYNEPAFPIQMTNGGGIKERWALQFTNTTTFNIIGEQVGVIGTGNTGSTCAPLNPATGAPYFSINPTGWGIGWAAGNVYRFNTEGANFPVWLARSVAPSDPFVGQDKVTVAIRGDIDA